MSPIGTLYAVRYLSEYAASLISVVPAGPAMTTSDMKIAVTANIQEIAAFLKLLRTESGILLVSSVCSPQV